MHDESPHEGLQPKNNTASSRSVVEIKQNVNSDCECAVMNMLPDLRLHLLRVCVFSIRAVVWSYFYMCSVSSRQLAEEVTSLLAVSENKQSQRTFIKSSVCTQPLLNFSFDMERLVFSFFFGFYKTASQTHLVWDLSKNIRFLWFIYWFWKSQYEGPRFKSQSDWRMKD